MSEILKPTPEEIRAQALMNSWLKIRDDVPRETKDEIGQLFIENVLGLGKDVAERFAAGAKAGGLDFATTDVVGNKLAGIEVKRERISKFWNEVKKISPQIIPTTEDLQLACEQDDGWGAIHLLTTLEMSRKNLSFVLQEISITAHAYK